MSKNGSVFQFGAGARSEDEPQKKPALRTVLGAGCTVEGKLVCTGPTRLDGGVTGTLLADDFLLIDKNAAVTADLDVLELVVRGRVRGNIRARRRVALEDSATVEGDIETPSITISDGAQVCGKVDVTRRAAEDAPIEGADMETEAIIRRFAPRRPGEEPAPAI